MVCEYYSPVEGAFAFYCIEDSEQRPEIWTKRPTIPAASMAKAVEALALMLYMLYSIRYFSLTEKAPVRIAPQPPSSAKKIPKFS